MTNHADDQTAAGTGFNDNSSVSIEYAKFLYEIILEQYKSATTKAQVILAIDGIFIGFIASTVFGKRDDLDRVLASIGYVLWTLLFLMAACIIISIYFSIKNLWSELHTSKEVEKRPKELIEDNTIFGLYRPEQLWFFQDIGKMKHKDLEPILSRVDRRFMVRALSYNSIVLAEHVVRKHNYTNMGLLFTGSGLILFVLATILYLVSIYHPSFPFITSLSY
jgi:hypothetical protein